MFSGLYFGIILILEKYIILEFLNKLPKSINHLYAIILILVGWVIFRVENIDYLLQFLSEMFTYNKSDSYILYCNHSEIISITLYFWLAFNGSTQLLGNMSIKINNSNKEWAKYIREIYIISVFMLTIMYLVSSTFNPFIYFRF